MSNRLAFHTHLASIIEDLANAAVAEICKLVDDDYAVVSLQVSQCQRENKALKRKLHLLELKMARGHAERRLREGGINGHRPRVQTVASDRRRDSSLSAGRVFEQQMDLDLWPDKDATGDTGSQPVHSDNIPSQLEDVGLLEPGVTQVKEEKVEGNMSFTEDIEDILPVRDNGLVERAYQTGVGGQRLHLEESIQNQSQSRRTRSTGNYSSSSISSGVERNQEPDVELVKVEESDPQSATQKWIDLGLQKGLEEFIADDYRGGLPFNTTQALTNPSSDLQESVGALLEVSSGHSSVWTSGGSSYCDDSGIPRPSSHFSPLSFPPHTLNGKAPGRGPFVQNSTGGMLPIDSAAITLSEDSSSSQAKSQTQGEQLCMQCSLPVSTNVQSKDKGRCEVSRKKGFICRYCEKGFISSAKLRIHLRTHTGERPYGCSFCGKKFSQFWNLRIHRYIHTGERPYECSLCPEKFSDPRNLKKHQTRHHSKT